jgi:hypothetical protein
MVRAGIPECVASARWASVIIASAAFLAPREA